MSLLKPSLFMKKVFETEASGITTYGEMPRIEQMNLPEEAKI